MNAHIQLITDNMRLTRLSIYIVRDTYNTNKYNASNMFGALNSERNNWFDSDSDMIYYDYSILFSFLVIINIVYCLGRHTPKTVLLYSQIYYNDYYYNLFLL